MATDKIGSHDLDENIINENETGGVNVKVGAKTVELAPMWSYGTEDIEAGSASTEPEGTLHFVYEA